jgi:hypothetical protein
MADNLFTPAKTINFNLIGQDGNAFVLLGGWQRQARREGWSNEDINKVVNKATSGDYNNLLSTLSAHCDVISEND